MLKVIITFFITNVTLALSPNDLVGCYQTLSVNSKPVNLKNNRSLIYRGPSPLFKDQNGKSIESINLVLFNQRHIETDLFWDEWSTQDIFFNMGKWSDFGNGRANFSFEGILQSQTSSSVLFNYKSNIQIQTSKQNILKINLYYNYTSNIGLQDTWQAEFRLRQLDHTSCLNRI